ncbi:MAG: glucosamine-6-phosphate deaminase [Candidatus Brocadiia bacterium]
MQVIIADDYEKMSDRAAELVIPELRDNPDMVLGLATGSTPLGLYKRLIKADSSGEVEFGSVTTFNLDEYVGLAPDHEQSYRYYMDSNLFDHIGIPKEQTHVPDGLTEDLGAHCQQYEQMINDAGGIDLQVLGIGRDGHLGFNEPGSSLGGRTQVVALAPETVDDNARFFENQGDVPRFAITMGIQTILDAGTCLMLASGESKAEAVRQCVEGPVSASCTASALQMHPDAIVVLDEAAASELERAEYYRWAGEALGDISDRL